MPSKDIDKLDRLVSRLEKYSEPLVLNLHPEDINSVIDEVLISFKNRFGDHNIKVTKDYSSKLPLKIMDRDQLVQAFSQIIDNCIEAMHGGGTLSVSTGVEKGKIEEIFVEFADTGKGISHENTEGLFSPFFCARSKGLGLGLPIAQKIVDGHEGRIEVDSTLKKGTSFRILLPVNLDLKKVREKGIHVKLYDGIMPENKR